MLMTDPARLDNLEHRSATGIRARRDQLTSLRRLSDPVFAISNMSPEVPRGIFSSVMQSHSKRPEVRTTSSEEDDWKKIQA